MAKSYLNCIARGDTAHTFLKGEQLGLGKTFTGRRGHRTYFVDGGINWGGTPHNVERIKVGCQYGCQKKHLDLRNSLSLHLSSKKLIYQYKKAKTDNIYSAYLLCNPGY